MGSLGRTLAGVVAWKLMTGLCIRRPAVITPCLSPLQKQISEMLDTMELENSHLSAHELREKIDTARLQQAQQKGRNTIRNTNPENALVTAHEQELLWQAENSKFRPAERVTGESHAFPLFGMIHSIF
ncbi:hypothetical protein FGIG_12574 [Fasciola gigantica]|uniref:Large ribosomal subunit protein mL46 N-terminal domain-containing protein n=1 Tax=Fasciola gigantica TaxID=46835 RepID=A0A504XST7_FASGI|nr:hypothetical protein FGIG_12574 [Fasciola gigantica]